MNSFHMKCKYLTRDMCATETVPDFITHLGIFV